jgi:hypothetical protein
MRNRPKLGEDVRNLSLIALAAGLGITATAGVMMARSVAPAPEVAEARRAVVGSVVRVDVATPVHTAVVVSGLRVEAPERLHEVRERVEVLRLQELDRLQALLEARERAMEEAIERD